MNRRVEDARVAKLVADMEVVKTELAKNTEITSQIRDLLAGFHMLVTASKWIVATVTSVSATAAALYALYRQVFPAKA